MTRTVDVLAFCTIVVAANVMVLTWAWRLGGGMALLGAGMICAGLTLHLIAGGGADD